ncbi:FecR domain-containing protein [Asticcacaulis sp. YBE204]|uniref:FecR family protein n=1 Tax=Asticcacaulis sp. YBE204 TaxID=1282363 RepID=UPI0003C3B043|nr:FecR domain-containing protein [Asticcacaulis sp. YBE204]ESQ78977.1 hypothetical protein AEYBE204_11175 [Asticcacaulis sp. YBE204]
MVSGEVQDRPERTRLTAEASVWLARLQNEARTAETEAAFQVWLSDTPGAQDAFDRVTGVWDILPGAAGLARIQAANDVPVRRPRRLAMMSAVAAVIVAAIGLGFYLSQAKPLIYETLPGQQQTVTLSDGSRVALNTDTQVRVVYSGANRRIELARGEALFDVQPDATRPFTVRAGDEQVRALGTSFVVRRDLQNVAVTLLKGKVEVAVIPERAGDLARLQTLVVLSPGERATVYNHTQMVVDRPAVEAATAWRKGEVIFANATLAEAVAEINRYGAAPIILTDKRMAAVRVSGVFRTNDAAEFAATIAQLNDLKVRRHDGALELIR